MANEDLETNHELHARRDENIGSDSAIYGREYSGGNDVAPKNDRTKPQKPKTGTIENISTPAFERRAMDQLSGPWLIKRSAATSFAAKPMAKSGAANHPIAYITATLPISPTQSLVRSQLVTGN